MIFNRTKIIYPLLVVVLLLVHNVIRAQTLSTSQLNRINELSVDADDAKAEKNFSKAADLYTEIATIYSSVSPEKAEIFYNEAFAVSQTAYDKMVLKNLIGSLYENKKDYSGAAGFYTEALNFAKETGNEEKYMLNAFQSIGDMYQKARQYRTATGFYNEALLICIKYRMTARAQTVIKEMAVCYSKNGESTRAEKFRQLQSASLELIEKTLFSSQVSGENKYEISELRKILMQMGGENKGLKDSLLAQINDIEQLQNAIQTLSDTLNAQQHALSLVQKNLTDKTNELSRLENYLRERNVALTAAFTVIAIITLLIILALRGYLIQRKQNRLLAEQKKIIDIKNEDITASIRYAERIQKALFHPISDFNKIFPESFIIFKPRDIVSGDFYWFTKQDEKIIVAAADCTGHGIPGAFMSVLGITYFDEIVNKSHVTESDQIINALRKNIIKGFHVTDETGQAKDGMDLALAVIDLKNMTLQFSGAYNPLLIIRDGAALVHKADRMPVGFHEKYNTSFTRIDIPLKKDDMIYMFSDGFLDQFGGKHGKKFLLKRLQEVLVKIYYKSAEDQKEILENAFKQWQGKYDQVDDVLLLGIKI